MSIGSENIETKVDSVNTLLGTPAGASVSADILVIDGYHDVPTADATTDTVIRDVIGRKTDTENETVGDTSSQMRYIKSLLNRKTQRLVASYTAQGNIAKGDLVGITAGGLATKIYDNLATSPGTIAAVQEFADAVTMEDCITLFLSATKVVNVFLDTGPAPDLVYVQVGNVGSTGVMTWNAKQDTALAAPLVGSLNACVCGTLKIAISYSLAADSDGYVAICTFDASDVVTVGTPSEFRDADSIGQTAVCSPATDVIIVCAGGTTLDTALVLRAATISTTTPTWGAVVTKDTTVDALATVDIKAFSSSIAACACINTSGNGDCFVMTLSGTTLTVGSSPAALFTANATGLNARKHLNIFLPTAGSIVLIFSTSTVETMAIIATTYSGTTIATAWGNPVKLTTAASPEYPLKAIMYAPNEFCVAKALDAGGMNLYFTAFTPDKIVSFRAGVTNIALGTQATFALGFGNWSASPYNFVVANATTGSDGFAAHGSIWEVNGVYAWTPANFAETTQFLGVAEAAISHAASGNICVYGIPLSSTKTGMDLTKAWYWKNSSMQRVILDTRIGNGGMVAYPINATEMFIDSKEVGVYGGAIGRIVEVSASGYPSDSATSITTDTNIFGVWAQVNGSVSEDSLIGSIIITPSVSASGYATLEIGTGVASSEMPIMRMSIYFNYSVENPTASPLVYVPSRPIKVTTGTRISARGSQSAGVSSIIISVQLYQS